MSGNLIFNRPGKVLRFSGPQSLWFLDQLLTNRIAGMESGSSLESMLLTPKGRIVAHGTVLNLDGVVYFAYQSEADLRDFFIDRVFATQVDIEELRDLSSVAVFCDDEILEQVPGLEALHNTAGAVFEWKAGIAARIMRPARGISFWMRGSTGGLIDPLIAAGGRIGSPTDWEQLRVADGMQEFGKDFDSGYLPQEAALERAVHFAKGCYLGQEAVAMTQRGSVKRKIRRVSFDGEAVAGSIDIGGLAPVIVTSVGMVGGKNAGIATSPTSLPLGSRIESGTVTFVIEELPGAPEGPRPPSARELREALERNSEPS